MKLSLPHSLIFFYILFSSLQPAFAFKLQPISRVFTPSGTAATQSYEVINDTKDSLAVEMSVVKRQMDIIGQESYSDANDDFLIYPPQILIKPNEKQTVRITWLGDSNLKQELAYRLIAQQLPIKLESSENTQKTSVGQVKVLMRYMGSLFVRPKNAQHQLVLDNIKRQNNNKGVDEFVITLHNQGTARAVLKNFNLQLTATGKTTVKLNPEQLGRINNAVILAGNKRRFIIPCPNGLPDGEVSVKFDFEQDK